MNNYNITRTDTIISNNCIILIFTCFIFAVPTLTMIFSLCEYGWSSRNNYYELPRNNIIAIAE